MRPTPEQIERVAKALLRAQTVDIDPWGATDEPTRDRFRHLAFVAINAYNHY